MAIVVFNRVASANTSTSVLHVPSEPLGLVSQKHSFCLDALIQTQIDTDQFVIYTTCRHMKKSMMFLR